jgi:hypothetical protein
MINTKTPNGKRKKLHPKLSPWESGRRKVRKRNMIISFRRSIYKSMSKSKSLLNCKRKLMRIQANVMAVKLVKS